MRYMFTMMNNARLSVGLQGLALAERAYQDAAGVRPGAPAGPGRRAPPAGRPRSIIDHPDVRRMLLTMKAHIEAMRALIYMNAAGDRPGRAPPRRRRAPGATRSSSTCSPRCPRRWCTDMGVEVTSLAIQVYGGMGYIEEIGRAPSTSATPASPPSTRAPTASRPWTSWAASCPMRGGGVVPTSSTRSPPSTPSWRAGGDDLAVDARTSLAEAVDVLTETTDWLIEHGLADVRDALAGATPYLRMFGLGHRRAGLMAAAGPGRPGRPRRRHRRRRGTWTAKVVTARFFAEQAAARGRTAWPRPVTAGFADLYAVDPARTWPADRGALASTPSLLASIPSPGSNADRPRPAPPAGLRADDRPRRDRRGRARPAALAGAGRRPRRHLRHRLLGRARRAHRRPALPRHHRLATASTGSTTRSARLRSPLDGLERRPRHPRRDRPRRRRRASGSATAAGMRLGRSASTRVAPASRWPRPSAGSATG